MEEPRIGLSKKWLFVIWATVICLVWVFHYVHYLLESQKVFAVLKERGILGLIMKFLTIEGR